MYEGGLRGVAADLVDDRVGVVRYVREEPRQPEDADFFRFVASACNTAAFSPQQNFAFAGGASANRESAALKAIGEAVERYCAAQYDRDDFPLTTAARADFACVDPAGFALYSVEQYDSPGFPLARFTRDTLTRWMPATDALTGATVHVPACLVHIPYEPDRAQGEERFAQSISTGLALQCSRDLAAISAIGEVIERDAFTIAWQARLSPPRIRLDMLDAANRDLVERFAAVGDTVHLLDLTLDLGICTILAVRLCDTPAAPALSVAASTDLDPAVAIRKSLEELAHTSRYMWAIKAGLPLILPEPGHPGVVTQVNHLQYWLDAAAVPEATFLWVSDTWRNAADLSNLATGDAASDLALLVDRIDRAGKRVLIADVTTPDIADLGLCVVRAVIPGLHPLAMGHGLRALGGDRLWSVPQRLGHPGLSRGGPDNPAPHPYP